MSRYVITDEVKLVNLAKEYVSKERSVFTVDILFGYIKARKIKFRKDMTHKRIAHFLSKSNEFKVTKNKGVKYYEIDLSGKSN